MSVKPPCFFLSVSKTGFLRGNGNPGQGALAANGSDKHAERKAWRPLNLQGAGALRERRVLGGEAA